MPRTTKLLGWTVAVGITCGVLGFQMLQAQQPPITRRVLVKTDLTEIAGKEGVLVHAEIAPGAATGKHIHPGDEFIYVLEGSLILERDGQAPVTLQAGEGASTAAKVPHNGKNTSATAPAKVAVVYVVEKGQPLTTPVP